MPRATRLSDGTFPASSWPGCYPLYYTTKENDTLCASCATREEPGSVTHVDINYEDVWCECAECNQMIDPAYITGEELLIARIGVPD